MSMPKVLLSIRQGRHVRFELVCGGSGGRFDLVAVRQAEGAPLRGEVAGRAGKRSAARLAGYPGLSQSQQLAEPPKPCLSWGRGLLGGRNACLTPPSCNTGGKSIQPLKMVDIGFRLVPNSETPMVITGISFECPCLNLLHPLLPNETDCL